ncbi:MAG TPA: preprotein translocase subunit SecE [Candidatus Gracilibacteria bacterium]|nr:preprotein translocase subunit SecE [Candidatus Gracilibacteria bacterium]
MLRQFWKDALYELSQVTWLSKKQAIWISFITVMFIIGSAIFMWGADTILSQLYLLISKI